MPPVSREGNILQLHQPLEFVVADANSDHSSGFAIVQKVQVLPVLRPCKEAQLGARSLQHLSRKKTFEWLARGDNLRPLHGERVDFLGADVAGEDRGAIRRDINLSSTLHGIHHPAQVCQACDGFYLAVG